jgi:hypothetical protein
MFICKTCLEKYYENEWLGFCKSYGPCEICHMTKICEDRPSSYLELKKEHKHQVDNTHAKN